MTARAMLNPRAAAHLIKLCGMLGSDHAGERAAAAAMADRFVRTMGMTWTDVITAPPEWQHMAFVCRTHGHRLSDKERSFLDNIRRLRRPPSDRQLAWLEDIFERVERQEAAA